MLYSVRQGHEITGKSLEKIAAPLGCPAQVVFQKAGWLGEEGDAWIDEFLLLLGAAAAGREGGDAGGGGWDDRGEEGKI